MTILDRSERRLGMRTILFAITIFLGAFLLFQIQPLIAKFILPWFGGSAGVWTVCMLFFQVALLAGYAYAHTLQKLPPRAQLFLHITLLIVACILLPIAPSQSWKPTTPNDPTLRILTLLTICVGLPYFLLASTGPLLQGWLARLNPNASPYRLYSLSNLASLLALLTYPFLFEPNFTRLAQSRIWSISFAAFAIICALCTITALRRGMGFQPMNSQPGKASAPTRNFPLWLLLPACGSMLLLATTNKICQEVAVIPFLWVVPLSLYLLSFVIAFDSPRWYRRDVFLILFPLTLAALAFVEINSGNFPILIQLSAYCACLFISCLICHGELARLKPPPHQLTSFYLALSAGGALGGLFVAIASPLLFTTYFEFPLSLFLTIALSLTILYIDPHSKLKKGQPSLAWLALLALYMLLSYAILYAETGTPGTIIAATRNFYGAISVCVRNQDDPATRNTIMRHGPITHGVQFSRDDKRDTPTAYFSPTSGIGQTLTRFHPTSPRRIGIIGLGAGTLASYAQKGDQFTFYEINPQVLAYAQTYFTFLKHSPAKIDHILGDARLSMERQQDQHFDLFILDAFNGDAIPVHLLTRQAFDLYGRHVNPDGLIAVHISNQHLDLRPIVTAAANHLNLQSLFISDTQPPDPPTIFFPSYWMILGPSETLNSLHLTPTPNNVTPKLWTDDDTSLFPILR